MLTTLTTVSQKIVVMGFAVLLLSSCQYNGKWQAVGSTEQDKCLDNKACAECRLKWKDKTGLGIIEKGATATAAIALDPTVGAIIAALGTLGEFSNYFVEEEKYIEVCMAAKGNRGEYDRY